MNLAPASPATTARLLAIFPPGHPLRPAVEAGRFRIGAIPRDRQAAARTLAEMEADSEAARVRFGGGAS